MGVLAQTFSETIYKTVISGCLWKGDEGLGMRKRLHFIFITLSPWEVHTTSMYYYFSRKQVTQKPPCSGKKITPALRKENSLPVIPCK